MKQTASQYWTARRALDKQRKLDDSANAKRLWQCRVEQAAVATVLPGQPMPSELGRYPVVVHNANGSKTVCNYLAA